MFQVDIIILLFVCLDGVINLIRFFSCGELVRFCVFDFFVNCLGFGSELGVDRFYSFNGSLNVSKRIKILRRGRFNLLKVGFLSGELRKVQNLRRSFGLDKFEISGFIFLYVLDVEDMEILSLNIFIEKEEVIFIQEFMKDVKVCELFFIKSQSSKDFLVSSEI